MKLITTHYLERTKLLLISFLLVLPTLLVAQSNIQQQKDSLRLALEITEGIEKLRTFGRLSNFYFAECADELKMDTLLSIYAELDTEAKRQGNKDWLGIVRANTLLAYSNNKQHDEIIRLAPEFIDYLEKQEAWTHYYHCSSTLSSSYSHKGEVEKAIATAEQLYNQSEKRQDKEGMGMGLYSMALIYDTQGRPEDYFKCIRECAELLKDNEPLLAMQARIWHLICAYLLNHGRMEELSQALIEFEKINERYNAFTGSFMVTSWANLWTTYAKYHLKAKDFEKAEYYCDKVDNAIQSPIFQYAVYDIRVEICDQLRQYDKALGFIEIMEKIAGTGYDASANEVRGKKIKMQLLKADLEDVFDLMVLSTNVRDSLRNIEFGGQIDELHTRYEVDKKNHEIERQQASIKMRNLWLLAAGLLILAAGLIIVLRTRHARQLRIKNIGLVKQIQEQDRLNRQLEEEKAEMEKLRQVFSETKGNNGKAGANGEETDLLLERLERLMKDERVYTDSNLNRKPLADALGTNEKYLRETIKKHLDMTVNEYINLHRLKHAKDLLLLPAEKYTIEAVAIDSGFSSRSTFYALFREHYGLSPDEFRRFATE